MKIEDFVVTQQVHFNRKGVCAEYFQLEFGGTFIEDITRQDLIQINEAIDSALIFGASISEANLSEKSNSSSEDELSANINKED